MLNFNFDFAKLTSSMFRVLNNVALDLQSGKMGVARSGETLAVYDFEKKTIFESPFAAFAMAIPAIAMRTELADLREGDIVINGEQLLFVLDPNAGEGYIRALDSNGTRLEQQPISGMFFQDGTILAVKNIVEGEGAAGSGAGMEKMMQMIMLSQVLKGGTGQDQMKSMMMMTMLPQMMGGSGSGTGMEKMMQMAMFSQMMGGLAGNAESSKGASGRGPF